MRRLRSDGSELADALHAHRVVNAAIDSMVRGGAEASVSALQMPFDDRAGVAHAARGEVVIARLHFAREF